MGSLSTLLLCFALIEHICVQMVESTLKKLYRTWSTTYRFPMKREQNQGAIHLNRPLVLFPKIDEYAIPPPASASVPQLRPPPGTRNLAVCRQSRRHRRPCCRGRARSGWRDLIALPPLPWP